MALSKTHIRHKRADVGRRLGVLALVCAVACVWAQEQPAAIAAPPAPAGPSSSAVAALSNPNAYQGLPVAQVEFRGLQADARVTEHLRQLVAQNLGGALDRQKLGRAMRALYATGRFADLQVEAQRSPRNEVSLVFVATENLFIGATTVQGAPKRPSAAQLRDAGKLELGKLYSPAAVEQGLQRMKNMLSDNGYHQAAIAVSEERHPEFQQINLHFSVTPGPLARIGRVIVDGSPGLSDEEILRIAKLHPGDKVNSERITRALTRLRKRFSKMERLEAQISITDRRYRAENNTLDYVFRIVRGPVVNISVSGAGISESKLRRYIPVYEEHAVDDDLLNEGRRNLRDYLQTQGYFDAVVEYADRRDPRQPQKVEIVYTVAAGQKHELTNINIEGNKYFASGLIRERLAIQPTSLLMRHGRFSQELLTRDADNIRDLYLANGFEHVKVSGSFQDDYLGQAGRMAVFIKIEEGPQTLVSSLAIAGTAVIAEDQLRPLLTTVEGQPYSETNVAQDRDTILNYYFNHGFPDATFTASEKPVEGDATRETVSYVIQEGPQVFVDRIIDSGLHYTKPGIAKRQYQIKPKDPLSQSGMLDTQRRLYDLGVFNAVNMAVQNPDGQSRYKDVFLQFEEARRWNFTYGFGIEVQSGAFGTREIPQGTTGVSPRVSFDVTRIDFGGRAHTLSFSSHVGRLEQRALAIYDAPRFLATNNLRLTMSAFYDNSLDVRTFTSQRLEGSMQLEQIVSRATSLLYRLTYRRVRATDLLISPSLVPLFSQPVRVGIPSLTYIRDRRDDPIDTHNGNYNTFDTGIAARVFGSEATFGRFLGQNTTYHPFRKRRWVFARNLRVGLAQTFGPTDLLPLPERFFAGGGNSLRGFSINQAGPRDLTTGEPLGGDAMVVNSFELRTPTVALPWLGNNMGFVIFHDAGNVFATPHDLFNSLLKWSQPHPGLCTQASTAKRCDFNYISHAVGGGIRYRTPIGPARLDFGYNFNPPVFGVYPDASNNFAPFHSQTAKRFNFIFSIGQTF
ncbi:MAG: BamA/TamA family outer membrane protein [Acidobacteriia bacterium]|nr:BamA/TamA family outer membrane protein [Terriglobia bacterium]